MRAYLDLVQQIFDEGRWKTNRTGVRTLQISGAMLKFDLSNGFPAVTTKRLAFKSVIGELLGFLRGNTSAAQFRALGSKVWDQNANENAAWLANPYRIGEDDLGPVYGAQWRAWPAYKLLAPKARAQLEDARSRGYHLLGEVFVAGEQRLLYYKAIDQLRQCFDTIIANPDDRRILFHGWNWAQIEEMALPPCHLLYHFLPDRNSRELDMLLYVRSNDIGLGAPYNISSAATLQHLMGRLTGYEPRWLTYCVGDAHIYENHVEMLKEQLRREPYHPPQLKISDRIPEFANTGVPQPEWFELAEPGDFTLEDYQHHPPLTAPMAV